ncbi:hypothetical protein FDECE_15289 [Fusarium decemcellulare]|nr:hypothetical protein FDECE_15289 [Fusarium decemcellulare]
MASRFYHVATSSMSSYNRETDDAEKGLNDSTRNLVPPAANAATSNGIMPSAPKPIFSSYNTSFVSDSSTLAVSEPKIQPPKVNPPAEKKKKKVSKAILLRLWFNAYRRLFTFIIILNLVGLFLAAAGKFHYARHNLGAMVLGNLLFAILMRNELFFRLLYMVAIYGLGSWAPIRMKLWVASFLQHAGGVHSGCAVSGAGWLVYYIVVTIDHRDTYPASIIVSGVVTSCLIIVSILSALPWVRNNHHNIFEKYHRFAGWLGLVATWIFVMLGKCYDLTRGEWRTDARTIFNSQEVWFTVFMTVFIAAPWVTIRHVPVEVEIPSPKVAVLRFDRGMQQGLLGRISRTSVMEFHAFGIISEGRKSPYHYMVCGVQGDFTKGLVANPPTKIWTRELKFAGIGHASAMFKRGIRICTGTGIGAALSTCIQSKDWFLIWIGSDQQKTFGPTISRLIHDNIEPDRMILWDSKERGGRPDSVQLLKDTWRNFGAEVIFITSNMKGNDEMMQGCREAGMHAFGTLWDF